MGLSELYHNAKVKAHEAVRADQEQRYAAARDAYVDAASALSAASQMETSADKCSYNANICTTYFNRAEALERMLANAHHLPAYPNRSPHYSAQQGAPPPQPQRQQYARPSAPSSQQDDDAASIQLARRLHAEEEAAQQRHRAQERASESLAKRLANPVPGNHAIGSATQVVGSANTHKRHAQSDPARVAPAVCNHCGQPLPGQHTGGSSGGDGPTTNHEHEHDHEHAANNQIQPNKKGQGFLHAQTVQTQNPSRQEIDQTERPVPDLSPAVDEQGRIVGANEDFHQDTSVQRPGAPDSGTGYRDKNWQELIRKPTEKVGPKQTPFRERETLADRMVQIKETSREGTRVNPNSKGRAYSIDGYEKSVYIDPNRTIDVPLPSGKNPKPAAPNIAPSLTNAAVLFETAAMGAKLRNTHRVGGERVKEMDHFVASVETPSANLKIPDVAPLVAEMSTQGMDACVVDVKKNLKLHVQKRFRHEQTGEVDEIILRHAKVFMDMIETILENFFDYEQPVEFYYMTTMRADVSVCSLSKENKKLYYNVLVFQQQQALDMKTGQIRDRNRIWRYWVQRTGIALMSERQGRPTGLYDPAIRSKFTEHMRVLEQEVY